MIPKFTAKIHDVSTSSHVDASGFLCLSEPWWRQPHLYILHQNWNSNIDWLVQRRQVSEPGQGNQDDVPGASGCGRSSERQADAAASVCMLPAGAGFLTAALLQKGILSPRNCEWLVVPSGFVWDAGKARQLLWVQGATRASEQRVLNAEKRHFCPSLAGKAICLVYVYFTHISLLQSSQSIEAFDLTM